MAITKAYPTAILNFLESSMRTNFFRQQDIIIETVDNPGWFLTVNLKGLFNDSVNYDGETIDSSDRDWYFYYIIR